MSSSVYLPDETNGNLVFKQMQAILTLERPDLEKKFTPSVIYQHNRSELKIFP